MPGRGTFSPDRRWSPGEQVRIIGEADGSPGCAGRSSRRRWRGAELLTAWGDPGFVDHALDTWAGLVTEPEQVTRTVQEITGSPARTFREWAADHAATSVSGSRWRRCALFRWPSSGAPRC